MLYYVCRIFFFKQKTAYEMRISDWSSDVCSSDLQLRLGDPSLGPEDAVLALGVQQPCERPPAYWHACDVVDQPGDVLRLYAIIKAVEIVQALRLGRKAHQREQRSGRSGFPVAGNEQIGRGRGGHQRLEPRVGATGQTRLGRPRPEEHTSE